MRLISNTGPKIELSMIEINSPAIHRYVEDLHLIVIDLSAIRLIIKKINARSPNDAVAEDKNTMSGKLLVIGIEENIK